MAKKQTIHSDTVLTGAAFADAVAKVAEVTRTRTPLEGMTMIQLKAKGNKMGLRACDMIQEACVTTAYDGEEFEACVNGELLAKLAKAFSDDSHITLSSMGGGKLRIQGDSSVVNLPSSNKVPPAFIREVPTSDFLIDASVLTEMIDSVAWAVETGSSISPFQGLKLSQNVLLSATGASRTHVTRVRIPAAEMPPFDVILDALAYGYILSNFKTGTLSVGVTERQIYVKSGGLEYRSVLLAGPYPDTEKVIDGLTDLCDRELTLDRMEFLKAMSMLAPLCEVFGEKTHAIKMVLLDVAGAVRLCTDYGDMENSGSYVDLAAHWTGDAPLKRWFNVGQMQGILKHMKADTASIKLSADEKIQFIVEPAEGQVGFGSMRAMCGAMKGK